MTPEHAAAAAETIGFELSEEHREAAAEIVSGLLAWAREAVESDTALEPAVRFGEAW